jgi:hypothetical protein
MPGMPDSDSSPVAAKSLSQGIDTRVDDFGISKIFKLADVRENNAANAIFEHGNVSQSHDDFA